LSYKHFKNFLEKYTYAGNNWLDCVNNELEKISYCKIKNIKIHHQTINIGGIRQRYNEAQGKIALMPATLQSFNSRSVNLNSL